MKTIEHICISLDFKWALILQNGNEMRDKFVWDRHIPSLYVSLCVCHAWKAYFFLIGVKLLYSVMLVSAIQQSNSAIIINILPPSWFVYVFDVYENRMHLMNFFLKPI